MGSPDQHRDLRATLVNRLREHRILLYRPPYASLAGEAQEVPESLIEEVCQGLCTANGTGGGNTWTGEDHLERDDVDLVSVRSEVRRIQADALAKLRARFVRVSVRIHASPRTIEGQLDVDPFWLLDDLKERLFEWKAEELSGDLQLKVIHGGRMIGAGSKLKDVNVRTGSCLMVLCTKGTVLHEADRRTQLRDRLQKLVKRAKELADVEKDESGGGISRSLFFELTDQDGTPVDVDREQRLHMVLAMTLHAEGRAAVSKGELTAALDCFFDAEEHVDCLHQLTVDLTAVTEAEHRLAQVRRALHDRCGGMSPHEPALLALFARLRTLDVVVAYHRGSHDESRSALFEAKNLILQLAVDDEALAAVVGATDCSEGEALFYLRTSNRSVERATSALLDKRERDAMQQSTNKIKRKNRKIQEKIGKTSRGEWVDVTLVASLVSLGFDSESAGEALRQTENDRNLAIDLLDKSGGVLQPTLPASFPASSQDSPPDRRRSGQSSSSASADLYDGGEESDDDAESEDRALSLELRAVLKDFQSPNSLSSSFNEETEVLDYYLRRLCHTS